MITFRRSAGSTPFVPGGGTQTGRVPTSDAPRPRCRPRHRRLHWWYRSRHVALLSLVQLWLFVLAPPVAAQQAGAAIDIGTIDVGEQLAQGERYQLPTIRVRNPGTITTEYRMAVQATAGSATPHESWFSFTPAGFRLEPDQRQPVEVLLELPADAPAGDYAVLVLAQVVPDGDGARVGAAAAARLTFSVPSIAAGEARPPASPDGPRALPWLTVLLVLLLVALLIWMSRRYGIRIERRR